MTVYYIISIVIGVIVAITGLLSLVVSLIKLANNK